MKNFHWISCALHPARRGRCSTPWCSSATSPRRWPRGPGCSCSLGSGRSSRTGSSMWVQLTVTTLRLAPRLFQAPAAPTMSFCIFMYSSSIQSLTCFLYQALTSSSSRAKAENTPQTHTPLTLVSPSVLACISSVTSAARLELWPWPARLPSPKTCNLA